MSFLGLKHERENLFPSGGIKTVSLILLTGILSISIMLFFVKPLKSQTTPPMTVEAKKLVTLTNQERINHHLPILAINLQLTQAAQQKAQDIIKYQKFSHQLPNGQKFSAPLKQAGYQYTVAGENLAVGFASPQAIVKAWMNSPAHRANILKPEYKDIGIAALRDKLEGEDIYLVVQYFGATNNVWLSENLIFYQTHLQKLKNVLIYS